MPILLSDIVEMADTKVISDEQGFELGILVLGPSVIL
jgi:hypothetical protein